MQRAGIEHANAIHLLIANKVRMTMEDVRCTAFVRGGFDTSDMAMMRDQQRAAAGERQRRMSDMDTHAFAMSRECARVVVHIARHSECRDFMAVSVTIAGERFEHTIIAHIAQVNDRGGISRAQCFEGGVGHSHIAMRIGEQSNPRSLERDWRFGDDVLNAHNSPLRNGERPATIRSRDPGATT